MTSRTPKEIDPPAPVSRNWFRFGQRLASTNLLYVLPLLFLFGTLALWRWSSQNEERRIELLTGEEATRISAAISDRLQGHVDVSARSGTRWLSRRPADQGEWDYDLFSRRWLHPELETVEWVADSLAPVWAPTEHAAIAAELLSPEDLQQAAEEHRLLLVGPIFREGGNPVSVTVIPVEQPRTETAWVVSVYDLSRVMRFASQASDGTFAMALIANGREVFASYEDPTSANEWQQTATVKFDRFALDLVVWPRPIALERLRTRMPEIALFGGLLATMTLALAIRLAQVSSRRAIESRMTSALQQEVRGRKAAEKSLERKLLELSRSNQEFERFAYAISHDLRDPLNAIHLNVQSVLAQPGDHLDPDARRRLEHGEEAVGRLDAMIGSLLEYARAGGGSNGLELVDAEDALDQAVANLQAAITTHAALVTHGPLPKVIAHREALTRLFQNLVANAVKYRGDAPPHIVVEAQRAGEGWVFSVSDNARGMSKREIKRAFDLFWRHDNGDEAGGAGIGLAVCKRIVERQGGQMWIESQRGADSGTTFFFSWPADPEASAQRRAAATD